MPASELNAEVIAEDVTPTERRDEATTLKANGVGEGYDLLAEDGTTIMKNNRLTIDDTSRQALSQQEIEELKKSAGGKQIIEKILANHAGLDEKTTYSKAKYTLRKSKKYMKRLTVLPVDLSHLVQFILDKEPSRIMELREEVLGLMMAWCNAHYTDEELGEAVENAPKVGGGRWLVADDAGGLVIAALAERMGILYPSMQNDESNGAGVQPTETAATATVAEEQNINLTSAGERTVDDDNTNANEEPKDASARPVSHRDFPIPATKNTITLIHPAVQPNISMLKYFGYDSNQPDPNHPLHTHLKSLSWLQLLHPNEDPTYREPEVLPEGALHELKSGKRGMYWKKRRRWERCKSIVDEAREGGFDGLVVASTMGPATILPHTVPLIRGGGHLVVYSPTIEPLVNLIDLYSKDRRTAYINMLAKGETPDPTDFPVDPRLLLAPTLQTTRVKEWQVLPGRTHPVMTSRGGAEGYLFTARKVVPLEGGVEARGNFAGKKRKLETVLNGSR